MNEKQEMEIAIEVLQMKRAITVKRANKGEFSKLQEELKRLATEEKGIYQGEKEIINKVLTKYAKEVREYREEQ